MTAPRVLLVEDEGLVALLIEDLLTDLGCEVVGSCDSIRSALDWLASEAEALDGALLDVNLGGELVYPVAEALVARNIPFAFATGYGVLPDNRFTGVPVLSKPVNQAKLEAVVRSFAAA
ncbi:MAG TPA: response regulator [Caulobacteraceae bacterium]|nr:response regulator [Caulobacteraceae bacterium]